MISSVNSMIQLATTTMMLISSVVSLPNPAAVAHPALCKNGFPVGHNLNCGGCGNACPSAFQCSKFGPLVGKCVPSQPFTSNKTISYEIKGYVTISIKLKTSYPLPLKNCDLWEGTRSDLAPTSSSYCQPDAGINGVLAERPYKCMAFSDSFHYEAIEDLYSDGLIPFDQDINVLDVNMGGKYECRSCAFAVVIDNLSLYNQHVWYVSQFASNDIPPDQSVGTTTAYMTRHRIYIWDNVKKVEKQLAQTCRSWNDDVIPKACAATMYDVDKDTYACWDAYNNIAATFQNASKKAVEYCYKWRLDSSHGKSLPELVCLS